MDEEILRRLEGIERRLADIEDSSRNVVEERTDIAAPGDLESTEEVSTDRGTVTTKKIPFCECGSRLEEFRLCSRCSKKVCDGCAVELRGRVYCAEDLEKIMPITVQSFKALLCMVNGITGERDVRRLTGLMANDVRSAVLFLRSHDYIEVSFLGRKSVTDSGFECITAWGQVLGGSDEMAHLDHMLRRHLLGN